MMETISTAQIKNEVGYHLFRESPVVKEAWKQSRLVRLKSALLREQVRLLHKALRMETFRSKRLCVDSGLLLKQGSKMSLSV
jgi:hypothetical protein